MLCLCKAVNLSLTLSNPIDVKSTSHLHTVRVLYGYMYSYYYLYSKLARDRSFQKWHHDASFRCVFFSQLACRTLEQQQSCFKTSSEKRDNALAKKERKGDMNKIASMNGVNENT